jgi:hypothetical protein
MKTKYQIHYNIVITIKHEPTDNIIRNIKSLIERTLDTDELFEIDDKYYVEDGIVKKYIK